MLYLASEFSFFFQTAVVTEKKNHLYSHGKLYTVNAFVCENTPLAQCNMHITPAFWDATIRHNTQRKYEKSARA